MDDEETAVCPSALARPNVVRYGRAVALAGAEVGLRGACLVNPVPTVREVESASVPLDQQRLSSPIHELISFVMVSDVGNSTALSVLPLEEEHKAILS